MMITEDVKDVKVNMHNCFYHMFIQFICQFSKL